MPQGGLLHEVDLRRWACCGLRGPSPGFGVFSSSPVHRAFVLVLGTNIAVLLDRSKSSRQCSLSYLLTYLDARVWSGDQASGKTRQAGAPKHRQRFLSVRPGGWCRTPVNSSGTRLTLTLGGGLEGPPRPVITPYPFPSASSVGVGRHRGSTWVRQSALSPTPSHAVSRCSGPIRGSSR